MSLASAKLDYALQLMVGGQAATTDAATPFAQAFTAYFKNATLNGSSMTPGAEALPHAVAALLSGVSFTFATAQDLQTTGMLLQMAIQNYWAAEDPDTHEPALKTMWPGSSPPATVEKPFVDFLTAALDKEAPDIFEATTAIADAVYKWLSTKVKVVVGEDYYYFE
jgi:hypothetical protein